MYRIAKIQLFFQPVSEPAIEFRVGRQTTLFPRWLPGLIHVWLELETYPDISKDGDSFPATVGVSGDWPAFAWLDKRTEISAPDRFRQLMERVIQVRDAFVGTAFSSLNELAELLMPQGDCELRRTCHPLALCESFCRSLIERACLDAIGRARQWSAREILGRFHAEDLENQVPSIWPQLPVASTELAIRHTVGLHDPISEELEQDRSLQRIIDRYGIQFLKIKISGDLEWDLERLEHLWQATKDRDVQLTLDGNESYESPEKVLEMVTRLRRECPGLFGRILFLEQPLSRLKTSGKESSAMRKVAEWLPLVIDEADGAAGAFSEAMDLGYTGVSHKNCKGVIKSLRNLALIQRRGVGFMTGEDLTNLPLIPLNQDLAVASALGLKHIERNGHHYYPNLTYLPETTRTQMLQDYPRLYRSGSKGVLELNIQEGMLDVSDLDGPGLGLRQVPEKKCWRPIESFDFDRLCFTDRS